MGQRPHRKAANAYLKVILAWICNVTCYGFVLFQHHRYCLGVNSRRKQNEDSIKNCSKRIT